MTPTLWSGRLVVMPFNMNEAHKMTMRIMLNDPEIMKYSEQRHAGWTPDRISEYYNSFDHHNSHVWGIYGNGADIYGTITATRDHNNKVANVGILVGKSEHGYGTKAWSAVCDWLLSPSGGMRKVEAGCMAENIGMVRIFEKTGMTIEGVRKAHFLFEGRPMDMILAAKFSQGK